MPDDYIVPNFSAQKVNQVRGRVPSGIGVRVKEEGDQVFHAPSTAEEAWTVETNGPNSQPGSTKTTGDWVGVVVTPTP